MRMIALTFRYRNTQKPRLKMFSADMISGRMSYTCPGSKMPTLHTRKKADRTLRQVTVQEIGRTNSELSARSSGQRNV